MTNGFVLMTSSMQKEDMEREMYIYEAITNEYTYDFSLLYIASLYVTAYYI